MIDKQAILEKTDLLALIGGDLKRKASTNGGEYTGACPFCGGRDRFNVQPNRRPWGLWLCRNCSGGKWQNAIDYVMRRDNCDFKTACAALSGGELQAWTRSRPAPPPAPIPASAPPPAAWQARALDFMELCEAQLWGSGGARALAYLRGRGLQDDIIRYYRLGFTPEIYDDPQAWGYAFEQYKKDHDGKDKIWIPRGITIPYHERANMWAINIRRPIDGDHKYHRITGSKAAIFGADNLPNHDMALFCEGEINAMIADQVLYPYLGVASLGAATNRLDLAAWGFYLLPLTTILIYYDKDKRGQEGAEMWAELTNRAHFLELPEGVKDIDDFYLSGGDLAAWLAGELDRLGLLTGAAALRVLKMWQRIATTGE